MKRRLNPRSGSALIEVLIAMLVLAIGILGVAAAMTYAYSTSIDSAQATQSMLRAQSKAEEAALQCIARDLAGKAPEYAENFTKLSTFDAVLTGKQNHSITVSCALRVYKNTDKATHRRSAVNIYIVAPGTF